MIGRAETDKQKRQVIESLLEAWKKAPHLRLGQLINCSFTGIISSADLDSKLFNIEDFDLVHNVFTCVDKV